MLVIIIIIIFVLLLVGVYFLGKSGTFNSKASPEESKTYDEKKYSMGQNAYLPVSTWSQFTPNSNDAVASGSCLNYTAPSNSLVLGFPSIDALNNTPITTPVNYIKSTQECIDPDQILAQAGKHTCQNPNNGGGGTGCITSTSFIFDGDNYDTGDFAPVGVTEGILPGNPYYIACGSKVCPGEIGLIVPQFTNILDSKITLSDKNDGNYPICLQNNGLTDPATGSFYTSALSCDLSDVGQVFRMIRYSFDSDYNPSVDTAGIYAAIIHRATGFYLAPNMEYKPSINPITGELLQTGYTYYFDSLIVSTDPNESSNSYVDLILINPKYDTVRNGIYWLLQNQTPDATKPADSINPNNSINCNASYVYPIVPDLDVPKNCLATGVPSWYNPCNPDPNTPNSTTNPKNKTYSCQSVPPGVPVETYIPVSPQQFVYIPNIYLVPKDTTDLIEYWTYLSNQYSIQLGTTSVLDSTNWRSVDDAYKGVWSSSIQYIIGDIVYYNVGPNEGFYMSIANPNLSQSPPALGIYWVFVGFDSTPSGPSQVLPLISNYQNFWNARQLYYGPAADITAFNNLTGDVVNSYTSGNITTFIDIRAPPAPPPLDARTPTLNPAGISAIPTGNILPAPPANNTYWQQIYTYNNSVLMTYVPGQLFSTDNGTCYIYTGPSGTSTFLPNLFTSVSNTPMLKKFMTNIPADVFYYSNTTVPSGDLPVPFPNPFYGATVPIPSPFSMAGVSGQNMLDIQDIPGGASPDLVKYYNQYYLRNFVIAAITPKLTTTPAPPSGTFTDTTKLYDSQFINAVNLKLQLQAPISDIKDPITFNYKNYNPFNVVQ